MTAAAFVLVRVLPLCAAALLPVRSPPAATTEHKALAMQLALHRGESMRCVLEPGTTIFLRRFASRRDLAPGLEVPCLSLTNIDVAKHQRRKGHARRAMQALSLVAADTRRALIVENVCSPHMHALVAELDGAPLWGNRAGTKGCSYFLPPSAQAAWQDFAVANR